MKIVISIALVLAVITSCTHSKPSTTSKDTTQSFHGITEIKQYLTQQESADKLHGVVLIADGDTILLKQAYGFKDLEHTKKHSLDGKLGLASVPKMFTAIAIMQLAAEGKLDINAPINQYLNDLNGIAWGNKITIKELLSHTSGLGFYWDYNFKEDDATLDSLYELIKNMDTQGNPQGSYSYSNNGYILLGKIIETVSGTPYKQHIKKNILTPLKMQQTQVGLPDGNGYTATAGDLLLFSKGLQSNLLVTKEALDIMIRKQSDKDYGLGFKLTFKNNGRAYGHTGGSFEENSVLGVASGLDIINDQYTLIVLTNRNPTMGGAHARSFIINKLIEKK